MNQEKDTNFWPDCKEIPAYGLMMSVCLSVRLSTFWLTSAFKFVLGRINQYITHGNLILQKPFLHFRARLNCDVEQNCLCHVVDHT